MKLYYSPAACSLSPHIVLKEVDLACDLVKVDLQSATTEDGGDYKKINPLGYVPVLEMDNGEIMLEGPAIVQYLADLAPEKNLAPPRDSFERYRLQEWLNFLSSELHKTFGALFNPGLDEKAQAVFKDLIRQRLDELVHRMEGNEYLMGDTFSVADAYLFTILGWAPFVQFDLSPWPTLGEYQGRIGSRPAVQAALKEEGLVE